MSDSDRSKEPTVSDVEAAPRKDVALPKAGRSATIAEIGRELGDLDFEPDDVLASLSPFEQAGPPPAVPASEAAKIPPVREAPKGSAVAGLPKTILEPKSTSVALEADALDWSVPEIALPDWTATDIAEPDWSTPDKPKAESNPESATERGPEKADPGSAMAPSANRGGDPTVSDQDAASRGSEFGMDEPSTHALPVQPPALSEPRTGAVAASLPSQAGAGNPIAASKRPLPPRPKGSPPIAARPATAPVAQPARPPGPSSATTPGTSVSKPPIAPTASLPSSRAQSPMSGAQPPPPISRAPMSRGAPASSRQQPLTPATAPPRPSMAPTAPGGRPAVGTANPGSKAPPPTAVPTVARPSTGPMSIGRNAPLAAATTPQRPSLAPKNDESECVPSSSDLENDVPEVTARDDAFLLAELIALPEDRLDSLGFDEERPASNHLEERNLTDAFRELTAILMRESNLARSPQDQAELVPVVGELLAMQGDLEPARAYVNRLAPATNLASSLMARQLAFAARDLKNYAQLLKSEVRGNSPHESRRHSMALYAEILRLSPEDDAESRRHLELSLRAFPSDPRFWLQRLSIQLNDGTAKSKLRAPSLPDEKPLTDAVRDLLVLRNASAKPEECAHPAGALTAARAAFRRRDFSQLLAAIKSLVACEAFALGASWLHACLTALRGEHRETGTAFVEALLERGEAEAELSLLERRLHATDELLSCVEAFSLNAVANLSAADRLSLGLSVGAGADTLRLLSETASGQAQLVPLARAARRTQGIDTPADRAREVDQVRLAIGSALTRLPEAARTLGGDGSAFESAEVRPEPDPRAGSRIEGLPLPLLTDIGLVEERDPEAVYPRIVRLLDAVLRAEPRAQARLLFELAPSMSSAEMGPVQVLCALLAQLAGAVELAADYFGQARASDGRLETAFRGLASMAPDQAGPDWLQPLVTALEPSARRTLLALEACISNGCAADEHVPLLLEGAASTPALGPLIALLARVVPTASGRSWPELRLDVLDPRVRLLVALLQALGQESALAHAIDPAVDLSGLDPQLQSLIAALTGNTPTIDIEATAIDDQLREWLQVRLLTAKVPFDLAVTDEGVITDLVTRGSSPIFERLAWTFEGLHAGNQRSFDLRVAAAELAASPAESDDILVEASLLDPSADPALGSIEAARRLLERNPNHLVALHRMLRHDARHGSIEELGKRAAGIAEQLAPDERLAFAWLAIVASSGLEDVDARVRQTAWLETVFGRDKSPPLWVTRRLLGLAQARGDDQAILDRVSQIRQTNARPVDTATLLLRASEAASRLGQWELAGQLLDETVELCPEHVVALSARAEFLDARGDLPRAAEAYAALAEAACMPAHKVAAFVQAATLWTDPSFGLDTSDRALIALEHAISIDPTHREATARLKDAYIQRADLEKLEQLLTQQLLTVDSSSDRAKLELDRARTLVELGRIEEAQSGLERVLSLAPDNEQALILAARLHEERGDFESAEQQLQRLAQLTADEEIQVETYQRLAVLYETYLEQPARAEYAYREVLKRRTDDAAADQLVKLLLRLENPHGAVELLEQLTGQSSNPNIEQSRSLELARILDELLGERRRAEEILDRARRRWPNNAATLVALSAFYRRGRDFASESALLDRSLTDARRALGSGRFDATFFEIISSVAELRDQADFANVARATLATLNAQPVELEGIGIQASQDALADALAPEVLTLPLRALLRKTGWVLCSAHPIELRTLRATPLTQTQPELAERLTTLGRGFGLTELELYVSPALGMVCQPTRSKPQTLVVGQAFANHTDERVREALAIRALRILSANSSALANTAPVDLWPLLAAYLSLFLPDWRPAGVDPARLLPIRQRLEANLPRETDSESPMLAADVVASIGNRASQLGIAVQEWGSRTALLALGNLETVLAAIAIGSGQAEGLSANPTERQKWIVRNPEARDLAVFSVTDSYIEARAKALSRS